MYRSQAKNLVFATTLGSTLALSGLALADDSAKREASSRQKGSNTATLRAEPTEVGIQANADQVKELQRELASRGFYKGPIDGVPGANTRAALRNFQVQQGIPIEGGLNARTRDSLGLEWDRQPVKGTEEPEPTPARGNAAQQTTDARRAATEPPRSERERSGTDGDHVRLSALTPEQTKEVQQRLQNLGFYQGPVDGVMGAGTRAAVMRYFQRQAQLAAQGMVDDSAMELFGVRASDVKAEMKTAGAGVIRSERPVQ